MFERFSQSARDAVVAAQSEARALDHGWIGTEHLLLGLLRPASPVAAPLASLGLTQTAVRAELVRTLGTGPAARSAERHPPLEQDDDEALRRIGIDIDAVRRAVEEQFGAGALDAPCPPERSRGRWWRRGRGRAGSAVRPGAPSGHIPFTKRSKKALELSLRESVATASGEIAAEHLVLGLLRADGLGVTLIESTGTTAAQVRAVVLGRLGRAA